jgi:hypothetical protein
MVSVPCHQWQEIVRQITTSTMERCTHLSFPAKTTTKAQMVNDGYIPKAIRVIGTKYDGSPRDEWAAQLIEKRGTLLRVHVPAGTEEIVQGRRRRVMVDAFTGLFWTDRWYNVWQFDRTEGVLVYANVAMPCQFEGAHHALCLPGARDQVCPGRAR